MDQPRKLQYCPICKDVIYDPLWSMCLKHAKGQIYQSLLDRAPSSTDEQADQRNPDCDDR